MDLSALLLGKCTNLWTMNAFSGCPRVRPGRPLCFPIPQQNPNMFHYIFSSVLCIFLQASAYGEAFDSNIKVEVFGDTEAARKLIVKEEDARTENVTDSENEQDQQEVSTLIYISMRSWYSLKESTVYN